MNEVKIILTGAGGRMGRAVAASAKENENVSIVAAVDVSPMQSEFPLYTGISEVSTTLGADVIVDFSHHTAISGLISYAKAAKCALIVCTTGHTEEELKMINDAASVIPVFRSGNMSLGINLMTSLVKKAASVLKGFDIEIIEKHHNHKLDAPSGTALMLAKAASEAVDYDPSYAYDRHSVRAERSKTEIGIHSVRGGTIVGEHDVIFAGQNEVVTLSHHAESREVFAAGAVCAAVFMKGKGAGLYDMSDVIDDLLK